MRRESPALIIFDCDGVLIDSEPPSTRVFVQCLSDIGLVIDERECQARYTGLAFRDCLADIEARLGKPVEDGWLAILRDRVLDTLEKEVVAIPHALNVVERVHAAGIPLCVASSSNPEYLERFLGKTGFLPFLGGKLFSSKMVARGKPAPDLFLHAAATMKAEPARTVVIEDSLPGVRGAVAAGMRVIGYAAGPVCDPKALADAGAEIVRDMRDLTALLDIP